MIEVERDAVSKLAKWAKDTGLPAGLESVPKVWTTDDDGPLRTLLEAATLELQSEDGLLRDAIRSAKDQEWGKLQPQGLSYWVFEHNLVYPIFRRWIRIADRVEWDERQVPRKGGPRSASLEAEEQTKRLERSFVDLVAIVDGRRYLFEAKWWAYGSATGVLNNDVKKLRSQLEASDGTRAFLITFWYGANDQADDFDLTGKLEGLAGTVTPVFAGVFGTSVYTRWLEHPKQADGYFALVAFEVGAPSTA